MCGIVGMAGGLQFADEQRFKLMLLLDYFRGQDSTGIAVMDNNNNVQTLKVADDPIILMKHTDFEMVLNGIKSKIFLGHNRASTIGASNRANAHPFTHGSITGVHNGTLTKECKELLTQRVGEEFGTDSETVFAHINKFGIDETIPLMTGAWALVYIDTSNGTLNMIRNKERPLWLCVKKSPRGLVIQWASEYEMILSARHMTDDKDELITDDEGFSYFPLPIDVHHSWNIDDVINGIEKPEYKCLEGKPTPPKVTYTTPVTSTVGGQPWSAPSFLSDPTLEVTVIESAADPFNGLLTEKQWDYIASYGCSFCGCDVHPTDTGLAIFTAEQIVLCPSCSDTPTTEINGKEVIPQRETNIVNIA